MGNQIEVIPDSIGNLTNLSYLYLYKDPNLILTKRQQEWIGELQRKGCDVRI